MSITTIILLHITLFFLLPTTSAFSQTSSPPNNISPQDLQTIQNQLGYIPTNLLRISARTTSTSVPIALQTYPLNGGSAHRNLKSSIRQNPFPTLYWLCHDEIHTALANLERLGYVKKLETQLLQDEKAVQAMWKSHDMYASERWNVLCQEDQDMLLGRTMETNKEYENSSSSFKSSTAILEMIQCSGISGSDLSNKEKLPSVKCLHAHYAHYRSCCSSSSPSSQKKKGELYDYQVCPNIIGKWTHDLLQEHYPDLIL